MTRSPRACFVVVGALGIAAVIGVDGNPSGPAALAARLAKRGASEPARLWMERARPSLARFGARIVDGKLVTDDDAERALKFAVRDDVARGWWLARRARGDVSSNADDSR